jgi:hypothetical protein
MDEVGMVIDGGLSNRRIAQLRSDTVFEDCDFHPRKLLLRKKKKRRRIIVMDRTMDH